MAMLFSLLSLGALLACEGLKRGCRSYDYFATGDNQIFAYTIVNGKHQVDAKWDVKNTEGEPAGSLSWALNFLVRGENRVGVTSEDQSKFYVFDPCAQASRDGVLKLDAPVIDLTCSGKITQPVGASYDETEGKIYFAMFKAGLATLDVGSLSTESVHCYPYGDIENDLIHNVEVMNIGKNGQKRNEVFVNHLGNIWGPHGWKGRGLLWFNKKTLSFQHVISNEDQVTGPEGISLRSAHIDANFEKSNVIWGLTQETCPLPTKIYKFEVTATEDNLELKATLMGSLPDRGSDKAVAGDGGADIISRLHRGNTELLATDRYGSNSGGEPAIAGKIYVFADSDKGVPLSSMDKLPEPTVTLPTGKAGYPRRTEVLRDSWVISANHGPPGEPLSVYSYPLTNQESFQSPAAPAMAGYILEHKRAAVLSV